jgi:hypothetical protein
VITPSIDLQDGQGRRSIFSQDFSTKSWVFIPEKLKEHKPRLLWKSKRLLSLALPARGKANATQKMPEPSKEIAQKYFS